MDRENSEKQRGEKNKSREPPPPPSGNPKKGQTWGKTKRRKCRQVPLEWGEGGEKRIIKKGHSIQNKGA